MQNMQEKNENDFPEEGNFKEQIDFVDGLLPLADKQIAKQINQIKKLNNPLSLGSNEVESDMQVKLYQHQPSTSNEDEFSSSTQNIQALLKRKVTITKKEKEEKMTIIVPADDDGAQTFKFNFNPDGTFNASKKQEISMVKAMQGLSIHSTKKDGYVVLVEKIGTDNQVEQSVFDKFTRSPGK